MQHSKQSYSALSVKIWFFHANCGSEQGEMESIDAKADLVQKVKPCVS